MKIVFSRKGFDDKYGGIPSVIWPETKEMLSFPIPVTSEEEDGYLAEKMSFKGHQLDILLSNLKYKSIRVEQKFHFDPMIQSLLPEKLSIGAFGQSGAALGHLTNEKIAEGDVFLFFGTFCECYWEAKELRRFKLMNSFHAIWGFLKVDCHIDIGPIPSEHEQELLKAHPCLKNHPHIQNRKNYDKSGNRIYFGEKFGTFHYDQTLRLSKNNFKKSIWELPEAFQGADISYVKPADVQKDAPRVDLKTPGKGQEFVLRDPNDGIMDWVNSIVNRDTI